MIKLIVSDMDGTLLNSEKQIPSGFKEVYNNLRERDIKFVVASGRPYYSLKPQFDDFEHDIIFVGDNGGFIVMGDQSMVVKSFVKDELSEIYNVADKLKDVNYVICTPDRPFTISNDENFLKQAKVYYPTITVIDSVQEVDGEVLKLAMHDAQTWQVNSGSAWDVLRDKYVVASSSDVWVDIMPKGVNKGEAVKKLQNHFKVGVDETMAFGDFHNDIEMLQQAKYSYAMKNAHDDVKKIARFEAPLNDEGGVVQVIEDVVFSRA